MITRANHTNVLTNESRSSCITAPTLAVSLICYSARDSLRGEPFSSPAQRLSRSPLQIIHL
eukprot:8788269-Pyramimonas_sp.AAC.1